MSKARSLYVHIPFCESVCAYCDFPKVLFNEKRAFSYIEELRKELDSKDIGLVDTIYIGGGTPTCLNKEDLDKLLSYLYPHLAKGGEFSIESNPENLSIEKVAILKKNHINRVSIGVQSTHEKYLLLMRRRHSMKEVVQGIDNLLEAGIDNINLDMIYGLPLESIDEVKEDAEILSSLPVKHLSAYSLIVEPGTIFFNKGIKEAEDETNALQYQAIMEIFEKNGFERYEVSNFAKGKNVCRHNRTYWRNEEYIAIGLGAAGYEGNKRYRNTKSIAKYLEGSYLDETEEVKDKDLYEYYLLCNLRLVEGFSLKEFEDKFGCSLLEKKKDAIDKLEKDNLIEIKDGYFRCTKDGLYLLDQVLVSLF